ncbi:hypothetical protein [Thermaerobacter composti]|uniref:Uncharacterized protein n=1 Tax=Thermaerobacter composti TaxID=554949 RepID=A0ABZ0QTG9_9FIRM|nr:hypothetical protein [Thermaerobacter composti]WPD19803.1 hypothetical protein Q5761_03860 [Thermaerobacter composti]
MAEDARRAGHRRGPVPRALAVLAWLALAGGLALPLAGLQRHAPPVAATAQAVAATGALLGAWQEGSPAAAGAWVAPAAAAPGGAWLAGLAEHPAQGDPPRVPVGPPPVREAGGGDPTPAVALTGYAIGTARPDAAGRIHVATLLDVAIPAAGYAGRFVQDLVWRPTLAHPRLVAASGRRVVEVTVRGHRLLWRGPAGPWQPGLGLADLPRHGSPAGGPPGVPVEVSRDGFGPVALAGSRGVLLTTRGPRPLVALWPWSLDDPEVRPAGRVVVLDVLYHARPLGWRVEAQGDRAVLTVAVEDGSRVEVPYDLDRGRPVSDAAIPGGHALGRVSPLRSTVPGTGG